MNVALNWRPITSSFTISTSYHITLCTRHFATFGPVRSCNASHDTIYRDRFAYFSSQVTNDPLRPDSRSRDLCAAAIHFLEPLYYTRYPLFSFLKLLLSSRIVSSDLQCNYIVHSKHTLRTSSRVTQFLIFYSMWVSSKSTCCSTDNCPSHGYLWKYYCAMPQFLFR